MLAMRQFFWIIRRLSRFGVARRLQASRQRCGAIEMDFATWQERAIVCVERIYCLNMTKTGRRSKYRNHEFRDARASNGDGFIA